MSRRLQVLSIGLLIGVVIGVFLHARADAPTITIEDKGLFVVANSYPANGTNAPTELVAGHWGDKFNVTVYDNQTHTVNWKVWSNYGMANQTLVVDANNTLTESTIVYLDLGTSVLSDPIYFDWSWN